MLIANLQFAQHVDLKHILVARLLIRGGLSCANVSQESEFHITPGEILQQLGSDTREV